MQITRLSVSATPTAFAAFADKPPAASLSRVIGYRSRPSMTSRREAWLTGRP